MFGLAARLFGLATLLTAFAQVAKADETIVVLGDSNTSGYGVGADQAFPAQMQRLLSRSGHSVRVVNAGIAGDTLGGMARRFDTDVPKDASIVIVQGGYNDKAMGVPAQKSMASIHAILAKLRDRRSRAILCGFFNAKWDGIGRKLASQYGAQFVPGSTCYDPGHRGSDGLHMSVAGHKIIGRRLAGVIERHGADPGKDRR